MSAHPNLGPIADAISLGAILGALSHLLPPIAAVIAVLWYVLQIWESETVQGWLHHKKVKHRHRRRRRSVLSRQALDDVP